MEDYLDVSDFVAQLDRNVGEEFLGSPTEQEPEDDE